MQHTEANKNKTELNPGLKNKTKFKEKVNEQIDKRATSGLYIGKY